MSPSGAVPNPRIDTFRPVRAKARRCNVDISLFPPNDFVAAGWISTNSRAGQRSTLARKRQCTTKLVRTDLLQPRSAEPVLLMQCKQKRGLEAVAGSDRIRHLDNRGSGLDDSDRSVPGLNSVHSACDHKKAATPS